MSMFSGALPQLASLLAQPAVLAAGVATGVAVGAVGVGTGAIPVTDAGPRNVALYECPDSARVVTSVAPNQSVLVTARSADGQWLEIYVGLATVESGWARAGSLQLKAAPESLPVEDCTPQVVETSVPTGLESPGIVPSAGASETPIVPTAGPATLPPGATPSPTPVPTNTPGPTPTKVPTPPPPTPPTGPQLSNLIVVYPETKDSVTGHYVLYRPTGGCPAIAAATIQVTATDPDGIASVTLWTKPLGGTAQSIDMPYHDLDLGVYEQSFYTADDWGFGIVDYWVEAEDKVGDISILHYGSNSIIELVNCD